MKLLKIKILVIVTILLLSVAISSQENTITLKDLWQEGNRWGTSTKNYFSNGTIYSEFYNNYTIKNTSIFQNNKVFVVQEAINSSLNPTYQYYAINNYNMVGGFSMYLNTQSIESSSSGVRTISTYNQTAKTTAIVHDNLNDLYKNGTFNYTLSSESISYYNYSGSFLPNQVNSKSNDTSTNTYLAQVTSVNKTVQAGTFNCWKIELSPLMLSTITTDYSMTNVTTSSLTTFAYQYFSNNTNKLTYTYYNYNKTSKSYTPTGGTPSTYYYNSSNIFETKWISKTLHMEIASEKQIVEPIKNQPILLDQKMELVYLTLKPQPPNLLLPVTLILLGGFTIGTIYVLVELITYRKTTKNIKHGNISFLSYLKKKIFKHMKKKEKETLSEKTLQKMEEIIIENKE